MKTERDEIKQKFGGRCAYCGCELTKGWHVDHVVPVIRYRNAYRDANGRMHRYLAGVMHPELETIENKFPACASCNINKRQQSVEQFREMIMKFVESLNQYSVQYKIAKRFGLVEETQRPIQFYFETLKETV